MTYSCCPTRNPADVKAWAEALWNQKDFVHNGARNAFVEFGDGIDVKSYPVSDYVTKEQKARRKGLAMYNKSLRASVLGEATLTDGVYTWPKFEKPETVAKPAKPATKTVKRVTARKIEAVAAILAKLERSQWAAFLAKWIGHDMAEKVAANDNLTEAARAVLRAAYAA